ncbi:MAG: ferrochelatase [Micropepsaceae bacterium]
MRVAVVLFNLGGPGSLAEVEPFLFNLFNDAAIIRLPSPLRWLVAKLISRRRAPIARNIYTKLGGSSPILGQTYSQASALHASLSNSEHNYEVFVAMRYSSPRALDIIEPVRRFRPNKIVLLPLYPQFSTTTSRSSIREWTAVARDRKLLAPTVAMCCYPSNQGLIKAHRELISQTLENLPPNIKYRLLFSAHGLPESVIRSGDPYQAQIEQTAKSVVETLNLPNLDWKVSYQSRVGPMTWIGPSTEEEIRRAGAEGKALVVVPIAFVSEHSETLVELDIEYAKLAADSGIPTYLRVPAIGTHPAFVNGLANLVKEVVNESGTRPEGGIRVCPATCRQCALESCPA